MALLPPGVNAEDFASAIKEFEDAVGKEWVFTSDEDLHSYPGHRGLSCGDIEAAAVRRGAGYGRARRSPRRFSIVQFRLLAR